jgi:hypothetical protein
MSAISAILLVISMLLFSEYELNVPESEQVEKEESLEWCPDRFVTAGENVVGEGSVEERELLRDSRYL